MRSLMCDVWALKALKNHPHNDADEDQKRNPEQKTINTER